MGAFKETFSPLKNRNFSIYFSGQTISVFGSMMQATAQSWVVWQLSHSTSALGLVTLLSSLPMLIFGAFAGVLSDRFDRRKLIIVTQVLAMIVAFVFAALVQTNMIQLWHIYILAVILGIVIAFDMPAQTAFIGDLSGMGEVRHAVVLNNMIVQSSRTVGPALAGIVMGYIGVAPAFWINGASFLAVIGSLLLVRAKQDIKKTGENDQGDMKEAFQYLGSHPRALDLILFSVAITFFGFGFGILFPPVVTDILKGGPEILGFVEAASGAGALAGAIVLAPLALRIKHTGRVMSLALGLIGIFFAIVAYTHSVWVWIFGVFFGSMPVPVVMSVSNGLIQALAPSDMKGRMLSIWLMFSFGLQPFGAMFIGWMGHAIGVQNAIMLNSIALMAIGIIMILFRKGLKDWQPEQC